MANTDQRVHHSARATPDLVRQIRASTEPQKVIAINTGFTEAAISLIRNRKRWRWLN